MPFAPSSVLAPRPSLFGPRNLLRNLLSGEHLTKATLSLDEAASGFASTGAVLFYSALLRGLNSLSKVCDLQSHPILLASINTASSSPHHPHMHATFPTPTVSPLPSNGTQESERSPHLPTRSRSSEVGSPATLDALRGDKVIVLKPVTLPPYSIK